jgi:hypothetical protein
VGLQPIPCTGRTRSNRAKSIDVEE